MKNKNSFLNYLKTNTIDVMLNEATMQTSLAKNGQNQLKKPDPKKDLPSQVDELLNGRWGRLSPRLIVYLMRFSQDWDDSIDNFTIDASDQNITAEDAKQYNVQYQSTQNEANKYSIKIQFPQKKQGLLMPLLKKSFKNVKLSFGGGFLTGKLADEKTMLNVFNAIMVIKNFQGKGFPQVNQIDSIDQLPKEWIEDFKNSITEINEQAKNNVILNGSIFKLYDLYKANGTQEAVDDFDNRVNWMTNNSKMTFGLINIVDKFIGVRIKGNTPEQMYATIKSKKFGLVYKNYIQNINDGIEKDIINAELKKKDEIEAFQREKLVERMFNDDISDILKSGKAILLKSVQQNKNEPPKYETPQAIRRKKLFEDAEYYGAQIVSNSKWIAAINRDYDQAHCFGRGKPKVKPGTNEIIPELNLRDDELEKLCNGKNDKFYELKAKRDSIDGERYKDRLGNDDQRYEAGWCVVGGNIDKLSYSSTLAWGPGIKDRQGNWNLIDSYFKCKNINERMPFITYLDCSTGRLYCSNMQYSSRNRWYQYDFNTEHNGVDDGGINILLNKDPLFKDVYDRATDFSFEAYAAAGKNWKAITDPPPRKADENKTTLELLDKLETTDNGIVILNSREEIRQNIRALTSNLVTSIKLNFEDGDNAFENLDIHNITTIDCSKVVNMNSMFHGTTINEKLNLVSTAKAIAMSYVFKEAKNAQYISGLDTSSAQIITGLFQQVQTHNQRKLIIPTLNLQNCKSINYAFYMAPIETLYLENTSNVITASGVIYGCYLLKNIPDLKFKQLENKGLGPFNVNTIDEIFEQCDSLYENFEQLNEYIKELEQFYLVNRLSLSDDKKFVICKTKDDVLYYLEHKKYYPRNVKLSPVDGTVDGWFNGKTISIDILDLQDVVSANNLFHSCYKLRIGKIINTDKIESAKFMFKEISSLRTMPKIKLPNAKHVHGIFQSDRNISLIKSNKDYLTQFNYDIVEIRKDELWSKDIAGIAQYIFGDCYNTIQTRFGPSLNEFLQPLLDNLEINAIRDWNKNSFDERGFLIVGSPTVFNDYKKNREKYPNMIQKCNGYVIPRGYYGACSGIIYDFEKKPIDFDNATSIGQMFKHSKVTNIGEFINADKIEDISEAFWDAKFFGSIPKIDLSKIKIGKYAFFGCDFNDNVIDELNVDMSNLKNGYYMFMKSNIAKNFNIDKMKLTNLEDGYCMFNNTQGTIECQSIDFPKNQCTKNMFESTTFKNKTINYIHMYRPIETFKDTIGIKEIKVLQVSGADCHSMFRNSIDLELIGNITFNETMNFSYTFYECKKLINIIDVDSSITVCNTSHIFDTCPLNEVYGQDGEYLKAFLDENN